MHRVPSLPLICLPACCPHAMADTGRFRVTTFFFHASQSASGTPIVNCEVFVGLQCRVKGFGSLLKRTGNRERAESGRYGSSFFLPRREVVGSMYEEVVVVR